MVNFGTLLSRMIPAPGQQAQVLMQGGLGLAQIGGGGQPVAQAPAAGATRQVLGGWWVWELRIDWGAGYRVYYAIAGKRVILLCEGGDKRTQSADMERAIERWQKWQQRSTP